MRTTPIKMISEFFLAAVCLILQAASAEGSVVAAPQDVHFHSVNLRNLLRWSPGKDTAYGTTYTVEYAIYGDVVVGGDLLLWKSVEQCSDITHTECDLTEQTLHIHEDYYARVRANGPVTHSEWAEPERRFKPLSDTILGPPHVKVTAMENYVYIKLKGPFRYKNNGIRRGPSLWKIIPHMIYNISVYNNRSKRTQYVLLHNDSLRLGPLEYESVHCVMAECHSLSLPLLSVQSDWSCITLPKDPLAAQMLVLMLGGVLPSAICVFVLAAVGAFAYYYVCGHNQKLPKSTAMVHMDEKQKIFQQEKPLTIFNLNFISTKLTTTESTLSSLDKENQRLLPILASPAGEEDPEDPPVREESGRGYAAQALQHQVGSDAASDQWSDQEFLDDDYGLVIRQAQEQDHQQDLSESEAPSECGVNLYMAQSHEKEDEKIYEEEEEEEEEEEKEEEMGTLVDWDPRTGVLKIPLLCHFSSEVPTDVEKKQVETRVDAELLQRRPILTSVVVRQSSEENRDDDVFTKMENDWGLQIQSSHE